MFCRRRPEGPAAESRTGGRRGRVFVKVKRRERSELPAGVCVWCGPEVGGVGDGRASPWPLSQSGGPGGSSNRAEQALDNDQGYGPLFSSLEVSVEVRGVHGAKLRFWIPFALVGGKLFLPVAPTASFKPVFAQSLHVIGRKFIVLLSASSMTTKQKLWETQQVCPGASIVAGSDIRQAKGIRPKLPGRLSGCETRVGLWRRALHQVQEFNLSWTCLAGMLKAG